GGVPVPVIDSGADALEEALAAEVRALPERSTGDAESAAGGPATVGTYTLGGGGRAAGVFEADGAVGGIAKTVEFNGYRFDLGGHRFFTKLAPVQRLWEEMLGEDFLTRPRLSRIFYDGKYFSYPIAAKDVVARLGLLEAMR